VSLAVNEEDQLDPQTQAILYRVAQEAVRNVIAYADAKAVSVEVGVADSIARLVVSDEGRGFEPEIREQRLTEGHLGLALLEELAQQAGGRLTVDSTVGVGTRIELEVPLG
jgi:signal transduction histidine kinase